MNGHALARFLRAALLLCLFCGAPALAQDRLFNKPLWFDQRLDACLTYGEQCGQPAADNFCRRRRYAFASAFKVEPYVIRTRTGGSNELCAGFQCVGFESITCTEAISRGRSFQNPRWKGMRLDNCRSFARDCGKPAADAWCVASGFASSFHHVLDSTRGRGSTRIISNDQICNGDFCVGFQMIVCQ